MTKRITIKAHETNSDPLLALLEWENTQSETLSQLPAQLLLGFWLTDKVLEMLTSPTVSSTLSVVKTTAHTITAVQCEGETTTLGDSILVQFYDQRVVALLNNFTWTWLLYHFIVRLAVITRPPDGVLLAPSALAARRLRHLASLLELKLPVVRTEFHNRSPRVASPVLRT